MALKPKECAMRLGLFALILFVSPAFASCPGVHLDTATGSQWATHSFFEDGTSTPLTVTLVVSEIGNNTDIEYWDGSSWTSIETAKSVDGSAIRVTVGGTAQVSYEHEDCGDELDPIGGT